MLTSFILFLLVSSCARAHPANELAKIFDENIYARLWRTALTGPPQSGSESGWPHYTQGAYNNTPASSISAGVYVNAQASGWTSGFFPDALWQTYRRRRDLSSHSYAKEPSLDEWLSMAQAWTEPLKSNTNLTSTHDLGFLAKPFESALQITGTDEYLPELRNMSINLANRFVPGAGIIRSWNCGDYVSLRCSHEDSVLVIIDNMMNLALLARSASDYTHNTTLLDIAKSHADKTMVNHVRPDGSSFHVCDYSATTGDVYLCRTAQGLADDSTWSRGQAWGIYGFAEFYSLTKDVAYLETAIRMANWFIENLPEDSLPFWDFNAEQIPNETPRDSSAAAIAASGLLLLQEQIRLSGYQGTKYDYHAEAVRLLKASIKFAFAGAISFSDMTELGAETFIDTPANTPETKGFEGILLHATSNNNPKVPSRNFDTGLSYGDFYLVEAGNRLLEFKAENTLVDAL
ncbi:unnamed protein product [Clonostachys rosea]|uniref:Glycoside hydrolase family 88 protein n=1 Tax=Bionectria ochroleuca TaxID=29856 RepID=A0ABY6UU99_BIOOC|nr:unnamed protein product [Clonostachys rosea]